MSTTFLQTLHNELSAPDVSDLHVSPHAPIWIRRSGDMVAVENTDCLTTPSEINTWLCTVRYQTATPLDVVLAKGGQDDFAASLADLRLRVHVWISAGQLNIAIRKLSTQIPALESLGLPKSAPALLEHPTGLILVVGATGSGKSTTLAAFINQLNQTTSGHIVTLEDPIEYIHGDKRCRVRQRHVGESADCNTFAGGVVAAMREDPDIIMVGEVRDHATMQACLSAAQTGHLVFATLHTNSAVESIERALAFYPDGERELARSVLSSTLRGVVAQTLVKTSKGGRVLAAELLLCTPAVRANILQNQLVAIEQTMEGGRSEGQVTMNFCLLTLFQNGLISREAALSASSRRELLEKRL